MTRRKKHDKAPRRAGKTTPAPSAPSKKPRYDRIRPWLLGAATALFVARPLFASEMAVGGDGIGVVIAWVLLGAVGFFEARRRDGPVFRWTRADLFLAAFLAWTAVSGLYWAAHAHARPAVNMIWQWIGLGFGFFLIRQFLASAREKRALVGVMIALAVGLSCYGLYQVRFELPQTRAKYEANPDKTLRDAGLWFPPGSPGRQLYENRLQDPSPLGTFALTNSLAGFLAPWLIVLLGVTLGMSTRSEFGRRWWRPAICLVPIAVCLWLTHSRTGVGAVLIGIGLLILYALRERISRKHVFIAAAIVAVGAAGILGVAAVRTRILDGAVKSFGYRLEYWYSSGLLISDAPLLGCGPGGFQSAYTRYKLPQASEEVADPHNFLIEVAATTGIPGLLLFAGLLVSSVRQAWKEPSETPAQAADSERWPTAVYFGAFAGAVLALPLGLMCYAPPGWASLAVAVPFGAVALWLLTPWVAKGECTARLLLLGAFVLMINLLAAGGIGFPGVAGSLWLLLGAAIWSADGSRELSRTGATVGFGLCCLLVVACYLSAYKPNLERRMHLARAMEAPPVEAVNHLRKAAEADPLSAEPWRKLAFLHPDGVSEEAVQIAIEKDPLGASFIAEAGKQYLAGGTKDGTEKAARAFERAIELYPNNATYHGRLAEAYARLGRDDDAIREAKAAFRLDELTPHQDKKLQAPLRKRLLELVN